MIGVCWNARGLGGARAFRELSRLVRENNPLFLFISESRICRETVNCIKTRLNFDQCFNVNPIGTSGGIVLFWKESMKFNILLYSKGHIDCISHYKDKSFYFTGLYSNTVHNDRYLSWLLINKINKTHTDCNIGWLVGGDFNEILFDYEKK